MDNKEEVVELEQIGDNTENKSTLDTVLEGIKYDFAKHLLVKPLDKIMVSKEITSMKDNGETNENGEIEYETETETKEVESLWREGIVLKTPVGMETTYKPGDKVVFHSKSAIEFDLFKTSVLLDVYQVIGTVNAAA